MKHPARLAAAALATALAASLFGTASCSSTREKIYSVTPSETPTPEAWIGSFAGDTGGGPSGSAHRAPVMDGTLGEWLPANAVPGGVSFPAYATDGNGHLFLAGGYTDFTFSGRVASVFSGTAGAEGDMASWQSTTSLPTALGGAQAAASGSYLYVIGGRDASGSVVSTVQKAPISGGSVGTWSNTTPLPTALIFGYAWYDQGHVYVAGGSDGGFENSDVFAAAVLSGGSLGGWATISSLPVTHLEGTAVVAGGYVYLVGGGVTGGAGPAAAPVLSAHLPGGGAIGAWSSGPALPTAWLYGGAAVTPGHLWWIGGYDSAANAVGSTVYRADVNGGYVASWSSVADFPTRINDQVLFVRQ